jgi:hypothetical protein
MDRIIVTGEEEEVGRRAEKHPCCWSGNWIVLVQEFN